MTGCYAPLRRPDVGGEAARLAGLAEPLAFRVEGDPLDAPGQTPAGLTLAEAVRLALTGSPEVQEALARVRAAEADAGQARLLPNPVLDVAFRFRDGGGSPVVEAGIAADLLSLLTQPRRVGAADDRLRAAAGEALATALDVLADVQQRYATAQALDAHLAVLENRGQLLDRALQAARARLRVGEGASLDVATLEGQRVELETDVPEARAAEVTVGSKARVTVAALPKGAFDGTVSYVASDLNEGTRTIPVRIEVRNADGALKAGMFARVEVSAGARGEGEPVLAVPEEAVVIVSGPFHRPSTPPL